MLKKLKVLGMSSFFLLLLSVSGWVNQWASEMLYQIRFSNTPFPIAALFDFMEKLAIPRKRKVFDILQ